MSVATADGNHSDISATCNDGSPFFQAHLLGCGCGDTTNDVGALHNFGQVFFHDAVSLRHCMAPAGMSLAAIVERCAKCGVLGADEPAGSLVQEVVANVQKFIDSSEFFGLVVLHPLVFPNGAVSSDRHHACVAHSLDELPDV